MPREYHSAIGANENMCFADSHARDSPRQPMDVVRQRPVVYRSPGRQGPRADHSPVNPAGGDDVTPGGDAAQLTRVSFQGDPEFTRHYIPHSDAGATLEQYFASVRFDASDGL